MLAGMCCCSANAQREKKLSLCICFCLCDCTCMCVCKSEWEETVSAFYRLHWKEETMVDLQLWQYAGVKICAMS
uniref:Uncharacterized protein n=1 Tax=Monopterus albus TaxID=43700 RepID=A0A3Q3J2E7_MONAL